MRARRAWTWRQLPRSSIRPRLACGGECAVEFTAGIVVRNLELLARAHGLSEVRGYTAAWTGPGRPPFIHWEPRPRIASRAHCIHWATLEIILLWSQRESRNGRFPDGKWPFS
jgi:hypothetical protein